MIIPGGQCGLSIRAILEGCLADSNLYQWEPVFQEG